MRKSISIGLGGLAIHARSSIGVALTIAGSLLAAAASDPGSLDLSFIPVGDLGTGLNGPVSAVVAQPDGRVVVGGYFQNFGGESHSGIVRLLEDGSLDRSFVPGVPIANVSRISRRSDGSLLVFGRAGEESPNPLSGLSLIALRFDGSLDEEFAVTGLTSAMVVGMAIGVDDSVTAVGRFTLPGNLARTLIRLGPNGQLRSSLEFDESFEAQHVALEPDGTALVMGVLLDEDDRYQPRVYRVRPEGVVDPDFSLEFPAFSSPQPYGFCRYPDGRLLLVGPGVNELLQTVWVFRRYNAMGVLDPSFQPTDAPGRVLLPRTDGTAAIAGVEVMRIGAAGGIDGSFALSSANLEIQAMALDSQDRLIIGGYFQAVNGVPRGSVARFNGGIGAPGPPILRRGLDWQFVKWGQHVTLEAVFGAHPPAVYRWYMDGELQAVTSQSRRLLPEITALDAGEHFVVASNSFGVTTSLVGRVSVSSSPQIVLNLKPHLVMAGSDLTVDATVYGRPPLWFQWFHGENAIPDANKPSLTLTNIAIEQTGEYTLRVTNQVRQSTMAKTTVTVFEALRLGTPVSGSPKTLSFLAIGPPFHRIHLQRSDDFAHWSTVLSVDLGPSTGRELTVPIVSFTNHYFRLKLGE